MQTHLPPVLLDLFPEDVGYVLGRAFNDMAMAEEEIARRGSDPPGLFLALRPPPQVRNLGEWVVRAHMRQMCQRESDEWPEPTWAEVVAAFHAASLRSPLRPVAGLAYVEALHRLAAVLEPSERPRLPMDRREAERLWGRPHYEGAVEEALGDAIRALRGSR